MSSWSLILLISFIGYYERSSAATLNDASALRKDDVGGVDKVQLPSEMDAIDDFLTNRSSHPQEMTRTEPQFTLALQYEATVRSESTLNLTPISSPKNAVNVQQNPPTAIADSSPADGKGIAEPKFSKNADDGSIPKVLEQTFVRNCTGEYTLNLRLSDGTRRAETAEFEERDGQQALIIRGLYSYVNKEGEYNVHLYIFDPKGYHEIDLNATISGGGVTDFRPEVGGGDCESSGGNYCIDQKLLHILIG